MRSGSRDRTSWTGVLFALVGAFVWPGAAHADDDPAALFEEGLAFFDDGDFEAALEMFERVYELRPSAKVLLNVGTALLNLERHAEAANTYQRYMETPGIEKKRAKQIRKILRRIDRRLGVLVVQVDSEEPVDVSVDGQLVGTCPPELTIRVDPGSHSIAFSGSFGEQTKEVGLAKGARLEVSFDNTKDATNDVDVSVADEVEPDNPQGAEEKPIVLGQRDEDPGRTTKETLGLALGASGLVALGIGAGFAIDAQRKFNRVEERCSVECVFPANLEAKARSRERLAIVLAGAGALAATVGVSLFLWGRSERNDARETAVTLAPTPSGAVAGVAWTF